MGAWSRDPDDLRARFERWLSLRQAGAAVAVAMPVPSTEALLVDAGWDGEAHRLTVRFSSVQHADPMAQFETRSQYLTLHRLRTQITRPAVPSVLWCEDDPAYLGAPFYVMTRVEGRVATEQDAPYTFGSWITEASRSDRLRMQHSTLEQLGRVHAAAPSDFAFLDRRRPGDSAVSTILRRTAEQYESLGSRGLRAPLIERTLTWLRERSPEVAAPVLCWGNARIENVAFRDFVPVALAGWDRATLAPREVDLGALIFHHRFVDNLAHAAGCPGLPDFLRAGDVVSAYADITGYRPVDMDYYMVLAAAQHAIESIRSPLRTNAFNTLAALMADERLREET
jgi:aminoglycoside phosphotransferase (APT) family kinase protein